MHHRRKCRINLHCHVPPLKADRIRHFVAVNMNADQCRVNQLHLNILIASFQRNLRLCLALCPLLHLLDDEFHLGNVQWLIGLRPAIANRVGHALDQLTGDTDDHPLGLNASLILGLGQRRFTIGHHTSDISNRALMHVAQILLCPTDSDDLDIIILDLGDQRLNIFRTDVETDQVLVFIFVCLLEKPI